MTTNLAPTIKAFTDGLKEAATKTTVTHGIKNIETWEERLAEADFRGAKTIHGNLGKLKGLLQADAPDAGAIGALLRTLGEETARVASHAEGKDGEKITHLAELLGQASDKIGA